jgi:hypothetical protein
MKMFLLGYFSAFLTFVIWSLFDLPVGRNLRFSEWIKHYPTRDNADQEN